MQLEWRSGSHGEIGDQSFVLTNVSPGSLVYSFEMDSVLTPAHHLAIMGQPYKAGFARMPQGELKALAGEGFSSPCIALVTGAYYMNPWGTWWKPDVLNGA